jgi:hypothetical protein
MLHKRLHRAHPRLPQARTHPGNLGTADVDLTDDEFAQFEGELAKIEIHGNRTDEDIAKLRETT